MALTQKQYEQILSRLEAGERLSVLLKSYREEASEVEDLYETMLFLRLRIFLLSQRCRV